MLYIVWIVNLISQYKTRLISWGENLHIMYNERKERLQLSRHCVLSLLYSPLIRNIPSLLEVINSCSFHCRSYLKPHSYKNVYCIIMKWIYIKFIWQLVDDDASS